MRIKGFLAPQRNASRGCRNVINQIYKTKADLRSGYLKLAFFSWKNTENLLLKEECIISTFMAKSFSPLKTWTHFLMSSWRLILKPLQMRTCHPENFPGEGFLCAAPECAKVFCWRLLELQMHYCGMQTCSALSCCFNILFPMQPLHLKTKEPPNPSQAKHPTSENSAKLW